LKKGETVLNESNLWSLQNSQDSEVFAFFEDRTLRSARALGHGALATVVGVVALHEILDREALASITLLSIFLLRRVFFCKMEHRGVGRPTLATQH
jgi:hypothetical protein